MAAPLPNNCGLKRVVVVVVCVCVCVWCGVCVCVCGGGGVALTSTARGCRLCLKEMVVVGVDAVQGARQVPVINAVEALVEVCVGEGLRASQQGHRKEGSYKQAAHVLGQRLEPPLLPQPRQCR
jgi:hypothetical protein